MKKKDKNQIIAETLLDKLASSIDNIDPAEPSSSIAALDKAASILEKVKKTQNNTETNTKPDMSLLEALVNTTTHNTE